MPRRKLPKRIKPAPLEPITIKLSGQEIITLEAITLDKNKSRSAIVRAIVQSYLATSA